MVAHGGFAPVVFSGRDVCALQRWLQVSRWKWCGADLRVARCGAFRSGSCSWLLERWRRSARLTAVGGSCGRYCCRREGLRWSWFMWKLLCDARTSRYVVAVTSGGCRREGWKADSGCHGDGRWWWKVGLGFHFGRWWRGKIWLVNLVSEGLWHVSAYGWPDLKGGDCHMAASSWMEFKW